jgi:DNA-binding NarL/FixJ family response regulator
MARGSSRRDQNPTGRRKVRRAAQRCTSCGLTNREIGSRLYLSEKTIEAHLTRVFQKPGLRSRAQVAAALTAIRRT